MLLKTAFLSINLIFSTRFADLHHILEKKGIDKIGLFIETKENEMLIISTKKRVFHFTLRAELSTSIVLAIPSNKI